MGGLARKASIIDKERLKESPVIVVDSGDLFFSKSILSFDKDNLEESIIRSKIIVDCNNQMGYSAFTPGTRDFALGLSYLKKIENQSNFSFVSCNLYESTSKERIFESYVIEDYNGFKIGYIGAASSFQKDSILVREPVTEVKEVYNQISKKTDYVIVLFNGTKSDLDRLNKSDIGFDLILRSGGSSRASENGGSGKSPIYESGNKGKYLNKIEVSITDINSDVIDLDLYEKKVKQSTKHLKNKKLGDSNANLDEIYKDKPKILDTINTHRGIIEASNKKINNAKNTIKTNKVALNTKVDSKAEILVIVDSGMARIPKGPTIKDDKGRSPNDPHHGHSH